ncbi:MAG TPA: hypothetical protein VMC79_15415, partial [Rectinemataceae bacterium]|nr:hypothetical protein [Rectinemataceae bacterium]
MGGVKFEACIKEASDMRLTIAAFMAFVLIGFGFAQDAQTASDSPTSPAGQQGGFAFTGGVNLGTDTLKTGGPLDAQGHPTSMESWTLLAFQPDIAFGKFGIGLDLGVHFQLYPQGSDDAVAVYQGDWVPNYQGNGKSFLDVYLPKFMYIRYGVKGEDPFYVKLGSIEDLTLGNGFIMGGYTNTRFLPDRRIFGLDLGLDGSLFNMPIAGFEAITGNVAHFDVVGGRVYVRPLVNSEIPIVKNMQVGLTGVFDTDPYVYTDTSVNGPWDPSSTIGVYGADVTVPLIEGKLFPLRAFTDIAFEPNQSSGEMLGIDGRALGIFLYGAQLRLLGPGFIPDYFDANYDLYRAQKFEVMQLTPTGDTYVGWYASAGTAFLQDKIVFDVALDGPFKPIPSSYVPDQTRYPHLKALFHFGEGIIPFFFDASYEKYYIGADKGFFPDLVDATNAVIVLDINYRTGATVL